MAIPNGLNPNVTEISFKNNPAVITGGTATGHEAIVAQVGTPGVSSVYLSSSGSGQIWVLFKGTATQNVWTQLTIN